MKTLIAAYSGVLRGERRAEAARSENKNGGSALSREGSGRWGTGSSILSALQDIFSVSWLNRSKVEKQLQVISVLQWVLSFLVLEDVTLWIASIPIWYDRPRPPERLL